MAKWWMAIAIVVAATRMAGADESGGSPKINLQLRNDAQIPAHVLEESQAEVARIFAGAGLTARWTDTAPAITVQIVPQVLGYARAASSVMGVALRRPGGSTAQVFFKQVQYFSHVHRIDISTMLAYVIVHEIGHLLMPGNAHSSTGIMQAGWDTALIRNATRGSLTFTEAQAARIRASY